MIKASFLLLCEPRIVAEYIESNGREQGVRSSAAPKISAKRRMSAKLSFFENKTLSVLLLNEVAVISFSMTYLYEAGA